MKVAIPSMDGASISAHFGRCRCFLVFGLEAGLIASREVRINGQAEAQSHEEQVPGGHHGHDHGAFVRLLADCQAVLCGGIGLGARRALEGAGLQVRVVGPALAPEDAARAFARGDLSTCEAGGCGCG